jgi:hypothetical protein
MNCSWCCRLFSVAIAAGFAEWKPESTHKAMPGACCRQSRYLSTIRQLSGSCKQDLTLLLHLRPLLPKETSQLNNVADLENITGHGPLDQTRSPGCFLSQGPRRPHRRGDPLRLSRYAEELALR